MVVGVLGVSSRPVVNPVEVGYRSDSGHVITHPPPMVDCRVMETPCRQHLVTTKFVHVRLYRVIHFGEIFCIYIVVYYIKNNIFKNIVGSSM